MERIRLGAVGSGGMAAGRMQAFAKLEGCEWVALAARNPQTGPPLAQRYEVDLHADWRELVAREDVDAVLIFTHNESHGPIAIAALEAGKHVFAEYPLARHMEEGQRLVELAETSGCVLRMSHGEPLSSTQRQLEREVGELGPLLMGLFVRLTPGRGARPEILFNLNTSGPPALFFVYQVYSLVDLFGPAAWVESHAEYVGLNEDGAYQCFVNTVTVGFVRGGLHQWTWAGGIEIKEAEQFQRLVLGGGTLLQQNGRWCRSTSGGLEEIQPGVGDARTLETLFLEEVRGEETGWREDVQRAFDAMQIGLAAERSVQEDRRITLSVRTEERL